MRNCVANWNPLDSNLQPPPEAGNTLALIFMDDPSAFGRGMRFALRPTIGTDGRVPKSAQPWPMEPDFMHMFVLTPPEGFESEEEVEALYSRYMQPGKKPEFPKPTQPWHQAQEAAYRGWEKDSARERANAAKAALSISAEAVDAYLLLAHDAATWDETYELEIKAYAAAEQLLGPDPFVEYEDGFWKVAITRPYMRARFALGYTLWRQAKRDEGQEHFQDLLRLNPDDNQGARYILTAIMLEKGDSVGAFRVMSPYSQEAISYWHYNRALINYRRKGDRPAARDLLAQAIRKNPHIPDYLTGNRQPPTWELEIVELGGESEAIEYTNICREAWAATPGALDWLGKQAG